MHKEVMTPVMPGYYGIKDSHRNGRLVLEPDCEIHEFQDRWIESCDKPGLINGDTAFGNCVTSKYFQGFKLGQKKRLENTFRVLEAIGKDFEKTFGRPGLSFFEKINWPSSGSPDLVLISMGPDMGTLENIIASECTRTSKRIAALVVRLLSPFPFDAYAKLLEGVKAVAVVNQAYHHSRGHLTLDISDALMRTNGAHPVLASFFAGLGGANVSQTTWQKIIDESLKDLAAGKSSVPYRFVHEGATL
jgi:pyruvate/2-oxoacid:ferredoxin oxidoreductase alpha subunit